MKAKIVYEMIVEVESSEKAWETAKRFARSIVPPEFGAKQAQIRVEGAT